MQVYSVNDNNPSAPARENPGVTPGQGFIPFLPGYQPPDAAHKWLSVTGGQKTAKVAACWDFPSRSTEAGGILRLHYTGIQLGELPDWGGQACKED